LPVKRFQIDRIGHTLDEIGRIQNSSMPPISGEGGESHLHPRVIQIHDVLLVRLVSV
jgi:hypothetical protein